MNNVTVQAIYQVWNDDTGCHVEVRPNADGLEDFVDILQFEPPAKPGTPPRENARITLSHEEAYTLADVLVRAGRVTR